MEPVSELAAAFPGRARVFPGARCEMLVFTVPWCEILKRKTDCAIRSEADVSGGGRLGTRLLPRVPVWLSMLVVFHLISVANTSPFLLFAPALNN